MITSGLVLIDVRVGINGSFKQAFRYYFRFQRCAFRIYERATLAQSQLLSWIQTQLLAAAISSEDETAFSPRKALQRTRDRAIKMLHAISGLPITLNELEPSPPTHLPLSLFGRSFSFTQN